ncbi:ABC transporter substrate-binding protein [Spirochaetia bacterium]|nr:ABC transporter substrate-binding protein [Spirochaetia bacterium]
MKKISIALSVIVSIAVSLISCNSGQKNAAAAGGITPTRENTLISVFASEPNTIDPTINNTVDGNAYINHAFEGLYRYSDGGNGIAVLAPGQAASAPQVTVHDDGTVTYVFTLRNNLKWSDGKPVTAKDFVFTWQRLVDPKAASPYNYMIDMVVNANEIMEGEKDKSELGIRAVNDTTVEITLTYDCPYFLQMTAFPATFPVREDILASAGDEWTFSPDTYVGNGPYKLKEWVHNSYILFEKNPNYYNAAAVTGPEFLRFALMNDANAILASYRNNEMDFAGTNLPIDEIPTLIASGALKVDPRLGTYYVNFNNQKAPFTDARVRKAFSLVIDRNYIVNQISRAGEKPADGFVPSGIIDAAGEGSDFRKTGGSYYSIKPEDYEKNVAEAQQLLADAGYPGGRGFPVVEYTFNTSDTHRFIGEALQDMWKTKLGVNVTLANEDWAIFIDTRKHGNYQIARDGWIGGFNDPIVFLDMLVTDNANNNPHYANPVFDDLIAKAKSTADPVLRMQYMHQAEDLVVGTDAAMAAIYFYTTLHLDSARLSGVYASPLGYYFFDKAQLAK